MEDQLTNDGQIDIDTVDEGSTRFPYITQSLPTAIKNITPVIGRSHIM